MCDSVRRRLAVAAVIMFCSSFPSSTLAQYGPEAKELFDDYFDFKLATYPEFASLKGYHKYDAFLSDRSLEGLEKQRINCELFKRRAQRLLSGDSLNLNAKEEYFVNLLLREIDACVRGFPFKGYLFADIDFMQGIQTDLPNNFRSRGFFRMDTVQDYSRILARLREIPAYIDNIINLLRLGIREGYTYARESLTRVRPQFDRLQVRPEASDFFAPFRNMTRTLSGVGALTSTQVAADNANIDGVVLNIQEEAKAIIGQQVLPAYQKLSNFIELEYLPLARPEPGIHSIPNGKEFYQACLEYHTTLRNVTPEAVHAIGLESLAELKKGVETVARSLGARNQAFASQQGFYQFLIEVRDQRQQQFQTREEVFERFRTLFRDRINSRLYYIIPYQFITAALSNLDVKPFPPGKGGVAYYQEASRDGRRPGTVHINVDDLTTVRKFETMSLALHEGNPGHHLQSVINAELEFPDFVRHPVFDKYSVVPSRELIFTAHVEGWGLYAEWLGHEMGLYRDPYDLLSFYAGNLLRAARLVVDTGIHYYGWSRQKALDFLVENTPISRARAETEVDRYITLPGQATAYKMGERQIRMIRERRRYTLGRWFDVGKFHIDVLACLGPLDNLEECIVLQETLRKAGQGTALRWKNSSVRGSANLGLVAVVAGFVVALIMRH